MKSKIIIEPYELSVVDSYNIGVYKRLKIQEGKMKGQEYVADVHFFPTIRQAALYMRQRLVNDAAVADLSNIDKLVEEIERLDDSFLYKLKEATDA